MPRYLVPLGLFVLLMILLGVGLTMNPRLLPSPLIGKPAPRFSLPHVKHPDRILSRNDLLGRVSLFNVWASWCQACRDEHPVLLRLARTGEVPIYGLNYRDRLENARRWLAELGDPYVASAFDGSGRTGIEWGVYGVPETYVLGRDGTIEYKHVGALTWATVTEEILPLVRRLRTVKPDTPAGARAGSPAGEARASVGAGAGEARKSENGRR